MRIDTKEAIIKLLDSARKKAEKSSSIEEKRNIYIKFLTNNLDFLDVDETIKPNSEEIEQLITDNFLTMVVKPQQIFEDEGYVPWLEDARKDISWDFYNRYEKYLLEVKKWKPKTIGDIDNSSNIILDHIANPKTNNLFNKQGLVIGDIQSGKTANYTALINKAIDAGYKIIIVLAGLTRDLRNQTQRRLDKEVLGFETKNNSKGKTIGVGKVKQLHIEGLTYADENNDYGDLKKFLTSHTLDKDVNPIIAVVKKNTSVLKHLNKFLTSSQSGCYTNDKLDIPVLIIDDEVDQASVDTKDSKTLEEASATNKAIRTILGNLNRYSYVGYTATPFANVFIDPDKNDIYPKDFILCLPSNEDYCGIKEYFGIDVIDDNDDSSDTVTDFYRRIDDYDNLMNDERVNATSEVLGLTPSLEKAIKSFIVASSIKKARGIVGYNSMLINIARFKNPSTSMKPLVEDFIRKLYQGLKYDTDKILKDFKQLWESDFEPISKKRLGDKYEDNWNEISKHLLPTVESVNMQHIVVLNGDSSDYLDYTDSKTGDYIVIGGDKLSRGLTLEGLVVSYYYRNSTAYDSLLQMGRWFGYRSGWIDVCRVYTIDQFMNDFINVGKVLQKFKSDVQIMYEMRLNPKEVGQKIMVSPTLIPTARNKMGTAQKMKVSFSNKLVQVITFNKNNRAYNLELTNDFIESLGEGEIRTNNNVVFKNVDVNAVLKYLDDYKDSSNQDYGNISVKNWVNYIKKQNENNELINWTVILHSLSNKKEGNEEKVGGYTIYKPYRTLRDAGDSNKFDLYMVKANNDPKDFRDFYDEGSEEYKKTEYHDERKTYPGFDSKQAILAIYVVDLYEKVLLDEYDPKTNKQKATKGKIITDGISTCGPAIWFSKAENEAEAATEYYVNKDYIRNSNDNSNN